MFDESQVAALDIYLHRGHQTNLNHMPASLLKFHVIINNFETEEALASNEVSHINNIKEKNAKNIKKNRTKRKKFKSKKI
jgi:hypothetical protein